MGRLAPVACLRVLDELARSGSGLVVPNIRDEETAPVSMEVSIGHFQWQPGMTTVHGILGTEQWTKVCWRSDEMRTR